jgi:tetratricopeptide (TPR) repeat protein
MKTPAHHSKAALAAALVAAALAAPEARALDTLFLTGGETRPGRVLGLDSGTLRLRVPLPPRPGAPPGGETVFATVSIPRSGIARIEFEPDPARDQLLKSASVDDLPAVEMLWKQWEPFLAMPKSPAGRIANRLGDVLLQTGDGEAATRALKLFMRVEEEAWDEDQKMVARQGRLRAMVATGRAKEAVTEALEFARIAENPAVLIEAKYIIARAADQSLRDLVEANPRWEEDIYVIPEHARFLNEALDEYLYPYLFLGSESAAAARGLWGAVEVCRFVGDLPNALECARDIVSLYPAAPEAASARTFIESLPEDIRAHNPETEARENLEPQSPSNQ